MICKSCNADNSADQKFCGSCGKKLEAAPAPVPVPGEAGAFYCARHKREVTRLRCGRCETPVCTRCAVFGPAGVRCRDCARNRVAVRPMGLVNQANYTARSFYSRYGIFGLLILLSLARYLFVFLHPVQRILPPIYRAANTRIIPITDRNSPPLKALNWPKSLHDFSVEFLTVEEWDSPGAPPADWLKQNAMTTGGATEEEIRAAEDRIGMHLPPSYRAFLKASNGLTHFDYSVYPGNLLPVQQIARIASDHPDWLHGWAEVSVVTPEQHIRDRSDPARYRGTYLYNAIGISDYGEGGFVCLCPDVRTAQGEWECWHVGGREAGVKRYPSFQDFMVAQFRHAHEAYKNKSLEVSE